MGLIGEKKKLDKFPFIPYIPAEGDLWHIAAFNS